MQNEGWAEELPTPLEKGEEELAYETLQLRFNAHGAVRYVGSV
jgi:hypothetical protein